MSDLHEAYEAMVGADVPLEAVRRRAKLRAVEQEWRGRLGELRARPGALESTANVFNHVEAAVHGWVPGGVR